MGPPPPRCASADTRQYMDNLDHALYAKKTKTTPSVSRARSVTIRHLTANVRRLQEELAAYEREFDARLHDHAEYHFQVEAGLRSRLRCMEHEANVKDARIMELESKLESMSLPQSPQTPTTARRMRRFPGGSHGPTPLILPYRYSAPPTPVSPPAEELKTAQGPFKFVPEEEAPQEPEPEGAHSRSDSCDSFLDAFLDSESPEKTGAEDMVASGTIASIFTKDRLKEVFGA